MNDQQYLKMLAHLRRTHSPVSATLVGSYDADTGSYLRPGEWIPTSSGRRVWLLDTRPEEIDIHDIARTLSRLPRFNSTTIGDVVYSIAQHCVHGSNMIDSEYALHFLLHDAAEYLTGDIITPIKRMFPEYREIERSIDRAVAQKFGLVWTEEAHRKVKEVDDNMLVTEGEQLLICGTTNMVAENAKSYNILVEPLPAKLAEQQFLLRFKQLYERKNLSV